MKKLISFIILVITFVITVNADNIRIISQSPNSITVQRTYTATETTRYQRVDNRSSNHYSVFYKPGNIGLAAHFGYAGTAFKCNSMNTYEIGGQLYYNFAAKDKVKFGISAGFDYGFNSNNIKNQNYWNIRAGIIICKYLGIGYVGGKYFDIAAINNSNWNSGIYGTLYLPFCEWFGLNMDVKYVWNQGLSLGGGIIIQMNTKTK